MSQSTQSFLYLPGAAEPIPLTQVAEDVHALMKRAKTADQFVQTADGRDLYIEGASISWFAIERAPEETPAVGTILSPARHRWSGLSARR